VILGHAGDETGIGGADMEKNIEPWTVFPRKIGAYGRRTLAA
jgi:hypothetical protein